MLGNTLAVWTTETAPAGILGGWHFAIALVVSLAIAKAYGAGENRRDTGRVLAGVALALLLALYATVWQSQLLGVAIQYLAAFGALGLGLVTVRQVVDLGVRRTRRRLGAGRAVLVASRNPPHQEIVRLQATDRECVLVGTVLSQNGSSRSPRLRLQDLLREIERQEADTVLLWGDLSDTDFARAVDAALVSGCRLLATHRTPRAAGIEPRAVCLDGTHLVELTAPSLRAWQLVTKRIVDVIGATVGLVLLGPLLIGLTVWIRTSSRGPAVFVQKRLGAQGRVFNCLKFRSMRQDAEAVLAANSELHDLYIANDFKLPEEQDPRLTRPGRTIRKWSLDELPQLINVLLGDMSLVGPRPIVPSEIAHYEDQAPLFLSSKPGMTGLWAVSGRSEIGYPRRVGLELRYIREWSLFSDLVILVRTPYAVLKRRGAH